MQLVDLQPGPQRLAAESEARVIFYGGAKGGGKSRWLLHESAKWFDIPDRSALIFRRTYPELKGAGALWDESKKLYPLLGAEGIESRMTWEFPSGATVAMRHLQHESDADRYNGKNIGDVGLDELTFFTERQFWILLSCMRSGAEGDPPKMRCTMNPDPDSWVVGWIEWYLDEAGFAIPERSGVVRWFGRIDGRMHWFDSEAAAKAGGIDMPMSFTFIAANIWDNPALLNARPEYLANLKAMPPVDQARFLGGNWRVRKQAGDFFQEAWFPKRDADPLSQRIKGHPQDEDIIRWLRVWDFASTPHAGDTVNPHAPAPDDNDPDWTRGGLFGQCRDGRLLWKDVVSCRDTPGAVEELVIETAKADGRDVIVLLPNDPGQAGEYQYENMAKQVRKHARVRQIEMIVPTKAKEDYAAVAGRSAYRGRILVQLAPWNREIFRELEAFPNGKQTKAAQRSASAKGKTQTVHDDSVDVLSQAVMWALDHPVGFPVDNQRARVPEHIELNNDVRLHGDMRIL